MLVNSLQNDVSGHSADSFMTSSMFQSHWKTFGCQLLIVNTSSSAIPDRAPPRPQRHRLATTSIQLCGIWKAMPPCQEKQFTNENVTL